jgi:transposase
MAPKTPQRRLTYQERARIHALRYNAGWQYTQISRELGIPYDTVRHCAKGRITPQKPRGRQPILNTPIRQRLIAHATSSHEQRLKPLREIAQELGINVDHRTLTKAFDKEGYHRRVATEKPLLTPKHIEARLFWANLAVNWTQDIWSRVIWSDEASFRVGRGKVYVTRRPEEKYLKDCCVPKYKDFSCVMVWACIGGDGSKGPLLIWDRADWGNFTSESYTQRITPLIQSFKQEHEIFRVGINNALLMQDNASSHRAIATKQYFHERAIRLLWWPANSPDLNPIENVWRLLKVRVQKRFPKTKEELIACIQEEWARIELSDIQKYCTNMNERCKAVI